MTPADTLALSADKLSQLLRDTIRERVLAAQADEQMRSDVLGLDVQAICDVIAYEADVIAGVRLDHILCRLLGEHMTCRLLGHLWTLTRFSFRDYYSCRRCGCEAM